MSMSIQMAFVHLERDATCPRDLRTTASIPLKHVFEASLLDRCCRIPRHIKGGLHAAFPAHLAGAVEIPEDFSAAPCKALGRARYNKTFFPFLHWAADLV